MKVHPPPTAEVLAATVAAATQAEVIIQFSSISGKDNWHSVLFV